VSFADLREWHELYGRCKLCSRRAHLDLLNLKRRFGAQALLVDVQTRLSCTSCSNSVANEIEVERLARDH